MILAGPILQADYQIFLEALPICESPLLACDCHPPFRDPSFLVSPIPASSLFLPVIMMNCNFQSKIQLEGCCLARLVLL